MSFFHFLKFVINLLKGVVSICHSFSKYKSRVLPLIFPSTLLQPKVEGPQVSVGGPTVSIEQRTRTKIKAVL